MMTSARARANPSSPSSSPSWSARHTAERATDLASASVQLWTNSSHSLLAQLRNVRAGLPLDHPITGSSDDSKHSGGRPANNQLALLQKQLAELPNTLVSTQFTVITPLETLVHGRLEHLAKDLPMTSAVRQFYLEASKYYMELCTQHKRFVDTYQSVNVLHTKHWQTSIRLFDVAKDHLVENTNVVTQGLVLAKAQLDERTQTELKQWADDVRAYERAAIQWLSSTWVFEKSALQLVDWYREQQRARTSGGPSQAQVPQRRKQEQAALQSILAIDSSSSSSPASTTNSRASRADGDDDRDLGRLRRLVATVHTTEKMHQRVTQEAASGGSALAWTTGLNWSTQLIALTRRWTDTFHPLYPIWRQASALVGKAHEAALRAEADQEMVIQPLKDRLALMNRESEHLREDMRSLVDVTPDRVSIALSISDQTEQLRRRYRAELDKCERLAAHTRQHKALFDAAQASAPYGDGLLWLRQQEDILRRQRSVIDATYVADVRKKTLLFTTKVTDVNREGLEDHRRRAALLNAQASAEEGQLWDRFESPQPGDDVRRCQSWSTIKPTMLQLEDALLKQYQRADAATFAVVAEEAKSIVSLTSGAANKFESWTWSQRSALAKWHVGNFLATTEKLLADGGTLNKVT